MDADPTPYSWLQPHNNLSDIMERDRGGIFGGGDSNQTGLGALKDTLKQNSHLVVSSNDSAIIRQTLRLYGSIFLAIFLLFCYVRRKFPKLLNVRSWVEYGDLQCELAKTQTYGFLSWAWKVFQVDDDQLLQNCGMDAVCFLRCLRLGIKLSLVGCFNAIWLIPTYVTAAGLENIDRFVRMSAANLRPSSPRFSAVVAAAYITVIASLYLLSLEYKWYIKYRHKFLSLRIPRNFAIYVSGIPESSRSNYALTDFFQRSQWKSTVLEATVAMNIPKLEAKVVKRETVLQKLEHTMALERLKGKIKRHRTFQLKNATSSFKNVSQTVESTQEFRKQLDGLNKSISLEIGKVRNSNHRLRSNLAKQKFDSNILRGRTLTPSTEELLNDHDIENAHSLVDHSIFEENHTITKLYPSMLSMESILELTPAMTEEIPEEDFVIPDAEYGLDMNSATMIDDVDSFDAAQEYKSPVGSVVERGSVASFMSACGSLSEDDWDEREASENAETSSRQVAGDSDLAVTLEIEEEESETTRPCLDLIGAGELQDIERNQLNDGSPLDGMQTVDPFNDEDLVLDTTDQGDEENPIQPLPVALSRQTVAGGASPGKIRKNIMANYINDSSPRTPTGSSIGSGRSGLSKRAGASVRQLPSSIRKTLTNTVNVETVAGGVKKARDLSISGTKAVRDLGVRGSKTARDGTLKAAKMSKKAAEYGLKKAHTEFSQNAAALAPMLRSGGEGSPRSAGFVTFKNHYTTQTTLQMLQHPSSKTMLVEEAPPPSEIFWRNVGLPDKARRTGVLLSFAATATLCLFWSFPVAFISSLTSVNSLKQKLPRLGEMIDKSPALEMILALVAPLLLLTLNEAVLPVILKYFAQWEGHVSSPHLEASLFRKLSWFQIIQTFFVSTVSGSLTSEVANMIDNPESIVQFLANSLPAQSSYFIQLVLAFTFLINGLELLRVVPLGYALVRRYVGPNLTEKERRRKWKFLYSLEDPPSFWHAETFSQIVLFYVVFFVYSTISPITSFVLLGCFVILESVYRYLFIHNFPTSPDSGGQIWAGFVVMMFAGILIGQLTLIGVLLLNEAFYSIPALVPLVIITVLFIIFVHPARMHVARNLPAITCIELDREAEKSILNDYDFLRDQYLQPALKQPLLFPDESSFTSRSSSG